MVREDRAAELESCRTMVRGMRRWDGRKRAGPCDAMFNLWYGSFGAELSVMVREGEGRDRVREAGRVGPGEGGGVLPLHHGAHGLHGLHDHGAKSLHDHCFHGLDMSPSRAWPGEG